jgi:hypothetical protein
MGWIEDTAARLLPHAPAPSAAFLRLRAFIAERMRMSPIDQPLMLLELLGNSQPRPSAGRGPADPGQRMVGKVLTGNGNTAYGNGAYSLIGGNDLSDSERDALQQLCRQRLDAFREQRGEEVFALRSRLRTPISGSVKYQVLTRARSRCECCGALNTNGPWRWSTSSPETRAAPTPSATCRRSASAVCRPATATAKRAVCSAHWSSSPSGCLGSLSTSETQCLVVASERTAIRS